MSGPVSTNSGPALFFCSDASSFVTGITVPVVNEENQMQGIVTADDALEKILPEEWKVKLPRMFNR